MDGKTAQKTSSSNPENLSLRENTDERYALLKVIPGSINRNRNRVDTANAKARRSLTQLPYKVYFFTDTKGLPLTVDFLVDIDELIHKLTAFLFFVRDPVLFVI
jgi:hypothetical protein